MAMKHYRFADISFALDARYSWLEEQCREYETEPGPKASALRLQKKRSTEKMYLKRRIQEDIWKALPFTGRFQKQSWITMLFCFTVRQ